MSSGKIVVYGIGKLWASLILCEARKVAICMHDVILGFVGKLRSLLPYLKTCPICPLPWILRTLKNVFNGLETTCLEVQILLIMIPLWVLPFYWCFQIRRYKWGYVCLKLVRVVVGDKGWTKMRWRKELYLIFHRIVCAAILFYNKTTYNF